MYFVGMISGDIMYPKAEKRSLLYPFIMLGHKDDDDHCCALLSNQMQWQGLLSEYFLSIIMHETVSRWIYVSFKLLMLFALFKLEITIMKLTL